MTNAQVTPPGDTATFPNVPRPAVEVLTTLALHPRMRVQDAQVPNGPVHEIAAEPYPVGTGQLLVQDTTGWRDVVGYRHPWRLAS